MIKIAVIFPGVGYNKDRPLLYYSAKQAQKCGYKLIFVDFSGLEWSKEKLKDHDFLAQTLERCLKITEKSLEDVGDMSGAEVLFISKSIGTVVATAYAKRKKINAKQICFSPLEMIESFVEDEAGILFYGDADPLADYKAIEKIGRERKLELYCVNGGNHSLETGDPCTDIDNLKGMLVRVADAL